MTEIRKTNDDKLLSKLTDEDVELIAIKVTEKIVDNLTDEVSKNIENRFFQSVGRIFIERVMYFCGIILVGGFLWLNSKGFIKF